MLLGSFALRSCHQLANLARDLPTCVRLFGPQLVITGYFDHGMGARLPRVLSFSRAGREGLAIDPGLGLIKVASEIGCLHSEGVPHGDT